MARQITTRRPISIPLLCSLILATPISAVFGQVLQEPPGTSLAVLGGVTWPFGGWTNHRYAGVDLFGMGWLGRAELEFRLSRNTAFALVGTYQRMGMGEWEDYARTRGDILSASSQIATLGLHLKPYLMNSMPDLLKLELGACAAFFGGNESFRGRTYEYDFMKGVRAGFTAGIEYDRYISDQIAIVVEGSGLFVIGAIHYADGGTLDAFLLPVTAGVRFSF